MICEETLPRKWNFSTQQDETIIANTKAQHTEISTVRTLKAFFDTIRENFS